MSASARREQLLDVTSGLIAERGFHGLSIEAVASGAGVTRATVYQHFADQEDLLNAVVERETSRALAQVSETALEDLTHGDPIELMLESLRAYLQIVKDHPSTWRLILTPQEGAPEALHKSITSGKAEDLPAGLTEKIDRLARRVYRALHMTGYARIDFRVRADGTPFVLEANANPNLEREEDFADAALHDGIPYPALLGRLMSLGRGYRAEWRED